MTENYRTFKDPPDRPGFGTIADIAWFMVENGIPANAEIVYDGCGTHNIAFEWTTEEAETTTDVKMEGY